MMHPHRKMIVHALVLGIVVYAVMFHGLKQPHHVAERRSILIVSVVLIYMILFGHKLPVKLNDI
jgi:hypothetical protein